MNINSAHTITAFLIFFFLFFASKAQRGNYIKTPAVGIHLAFIDFKGADSLQSFGRFMKSGLSINYQNNVSRQIDYSVTLTGSFLDFPDKKNNSLGNGKSKPLSLPMFED